MSVLLAAVLVAVSTAAVLMVPGEGPDEVKGAGEDDGEVQVASVDRVVSSFDGTRLALTLWFDQDPTGEPRPMVLVAHPWASHRGAMGGLAHWLVGEGYHVVGWDARGFGESGGLVGINGPQEQQDVSAIIDWLEDGSGLPDGVVLAWQNGSPRIGMAGTSYGGAIQLLAAAHDDRIDAIVPDATWNDLEASLAPDGVVKPTWLYLLEATGFLEAGTEATQGTGDSPRLKQPLQSWFQEAASTGVLPDGADVALRERSPGPYLENVSAHVLLMHAMDDSLFPLDQALTSYDALSGREDAQTHLVVYQGDHGHQWQEDDLMVYLGIVKEFLASHLKDGDDTMSSLPAVLVQEAVGGPWTAHEAWSQATG